jgi:hypothetical protein
MFRAPWASLISFSIPTLAASAGTIPSRAGYTLSMLNTPISPHMIPLDCRVNGVWCLDPTPLQVLTLCGLHSVYNDKASEIGEVPKLVDRLLDASTHRLGVPISPGSSNRTICVGPNCCIISWTISCLNCDYRIWLGGNWRLIWKSLNVCLAIWCCCCPPCCNMISR